MAKRSEQILIGVDVGSAFIRAAAISHERNGRYREVLATSKLPSLGVDHGNVTEPEVVADIFRDVISHVERKIGGRADGILVSLGGSYLNSYHSNGSTLISRGDGTVSDIDIENALKEAEKGVSDIKNKTILHTIPLRFKLDGEEVHGNILGLRGHKLEVKVLFITYPTQYFKTFKDMLSESDIDVADIIAGPIAESVPLLTKKQKLAGIAVINIGAEATSILVYENNVPLLVSVIQSGGNDITKDLALGMKISLEEAEEIKCGTSTQNFSKRRMEEIIEARIEDLGEKINKELDRIHRRELLPGGILVLGETSLLPKIDSMMRFVLKLPVKVASNELSIISNGTLNDVSYARSYGLCFLAPQIEEHVVVAQYLRRITTTLKRFFVQFLP